MRTLTPLALVLSFVVAVAVLQGSGAAGYIGGGALGDSEAQSDVKTLSQKKNVSGQAAANEGSIVGLVVGAARDVGDIAALAAFFPSVLKAVGLPNWLANPVGWVAQIVTFVGLAQFIAGRVYE